MKYTEIDGQKCSIMYCGDGECPFYNNHRNSCQHPKRYGYSCDWEEESEGFPNICPLREVGE